MKNPGGRDTGRSPTARTSSWSSRLRHSWLMRHPFATPRTLSPRVSNATSTLARSCGERARARGVHTRVVTKPSGDLQVLDIDGALFSDFEGFAGEFTRLLDDHTWRGNLDAFNDILRGGFGTPVP